MIMYNVINVNQKVNFLLEEPTIRGVKRNGNIGEATVKKNPVAQQTFEHQSLQTKKSRK